MAVMPRRRCCPSAVSVISGRDSVPARVAEKVRNMKAWILAALTVLLTGCAAPEEVQQEQALQVKTVTVASETIPNVVELPGRVEPIRVSEVRARVTGIVEQRLYEEGTDVRAGQPLFRIDPRELRASYAQIEASLARARATAVNADAVVARYRPLVAENAISKQEFDAALAASREAAANVSQIRAELQAASLQLGYTTVRAAISGRAGRAEVTEGALVSQAEATLLDADRATIDRICKFCPVSFGSHCNPAGDCRRRDRSGRKRAGRGAHRFCRWH